MIRIVNKLGTVIMAALINAPNWLYNIKKIPRRGASIADNLQCNCIKYKDVFRTSTTETSFTTNAG